MAAPFIGIHAPVSRSGKTLLAVELSEILGDAQVIGFADPLRAMVLAMLDVMETPKAQTYVCGQWKEREIPGIGVSARRLLQTLGTEWGREIIRPTLWVDLAFQRAEALQRSKGARTVIFDDLRFPNELEALQKRGALLVYLERPEEAPKGNHASEQALPQDCFDIRIVNDGTKRQLLMAARKLAKVGWPLRFQLTIRCSELVPHFPEEEE